MTGELGIDSLNRRASLRRRNRRRRPQRRGLQGPSGRWRWAAVVAVLSLVLAWIAVSRRGEDAQEAATVGVTAFVGPGSRELPGDVMGVNGARLTMSADCWLDPVAAQHTRELSPMTLRIFGGATANYWDWRAGRFVTRGITAAMEVHNNSQPPVQLPDWAAFTRTAGVTPVFNLNVMTSSLKEQLSMLSKAQRLGMPVRFVELGNEFYFGHSDYRDAFPSATDYARLANEWAAAIHDMFPQATVAAVAASSPAQVDRDAGSRQREWNDELFRSLSASVDAVTLHAYWRTGRVVSDEASVAPAFAGARSRWRSVASDIARIPPRFDVWVTEWNLHDLGGPVAGTWDQGLGVAAFGAELLRSPRVRLSEFHSLFGDSGFSALVASESPSRPAGALCDRRVTGDSQLTLSPAGTVLKHLFELARPGTRVRSLDFYSEAAGSPPASPVVARGQLMGVTGITFEQESRAALLVNATNAEVDVQLPEPLTGGTATVMAGPPDTVLAENLVARRLTYRHSVTLPPYSVAVLAVDPAP